MIDNNNNKTMSGRGWSDTRVIKEEVPLLARSTLGLIACNPAQSKFRPFPTQHQEMMHRPESASQQPQQSSQGVSDAPGSQLSGKIEIPTTSLSIGIPMFSVLRAQCCRFLRLD